MIIKDNWPVFALMAFAVASGQMGRLGKRYEDGLPVGRKQIVVELTMLPAFGALGGALAADYHWPLWTVLMVGIAAGWTGFGTFRMIVSVWRVIARQTIGVDAAKNAPPEA